MTLVGKLVGPPSSVCLHVLMAGFVASNVGTTCIENPLQAGSWSMTAAGLCKRHAALAWRPVVR